MNGKDCPTHILGEKIGTASKTKRAEGLYHRESLTRTSEKSHLEPSEKKS